MTETTGPRVRLIVECSYWLVAVVFFVYLFIYFWTSEGGPTLLAMTLVPVTYVLFVLNGLRENDFYPALPPWTNYVIAAIYIGLALAVAAYMHTEYYEIGTERGRGKVAGEQIEFEHRVTNVYRREGGQWKMVHHHTDVSPAMVEVLRRLQAA